ncbi:hypothetical protein ABPG74_017079 [Tetrahymena malaccensis]
MDVEPSQPVELEFVDEGEQDEIFKKQNKNQPNSSANKSISKAELLNYISSKNNTTKKSAQKDMINEDIEIQENEQRKSQSVQDLEIELEIENDIFEQPNKQNSSQIQNTLEEVSSDNLGNKIQKLDLKEGDLLQKQKKKQRTDGYQVYETFTCMLNLTDISYGEKGHNKFYQIEVLHKGYTVFNLYTKWGRVGAQNPQESYKRMDNKYDAILAFKKKFYDKTHNDWTGTFSDFKPQPGKYTWIQVDASSGGSKNSVNEDIERINKRNAELKKRMNSNPSKLENSIKDLMLLIWDFNRINKTLKELNFDTEKNPLGRLTFDQIQKGYKILTEIQNALLQGSRTSIIIELTNQFYTNIPQNYGMRALPMIDHMTKVKEKLHLLDVLKEIDITNRYINQAFQAQGAETINPLDTFYSMLKCNINKLEEQSQTYQVIQQMVENTHGPTHEKYRLKIVSIYELNRNQENQRFFPFKQLPNQTLLWHGSRISNFVGILSEGLRIAPPEAPMTGYMFGKGIYMADVVSKAAGYCHAKLDSPEGLLVLCETALGQIYECNKAKSFKKPPQYYHSVKGVGKYKTQSEGIQKIGSTQCFTGKVVESDENGDGQPKDLAYNEYIVYDTSQVKMKYLIRVNFEFL